ncbi:MAG: hypothetical protein V4635_13430 [Bacteroidota bacterium]
MRRFIFLSMLMICTIPGIRMAAQINILSIPLQPFNITAESLLNVNIMNNEGEKQVLLLTQLFNSGSKVLVTVRSQVFQLKSGLNSGLRSVASAEFAETAQANYLKSTHNLASGRYKVCCTILIAGGADKIDDFCDELEADFNQYLYLVNPFDGDTIESKNPILSWTHSEPFSILEQGESYRMVVAEMKKDQSPDEAITANSPDMVKNYLLDHQLQYPYDAKELKPNSKYAWQVQKLSDGVVINKTEAWVFHTRKPTETKEVKYVSMKRHSDGSYYQAVNGLVYFKFSEEYKTGGALKFNLTNDKQELVEINIFKDTPRKQTNGTVLKIQGDNLCELDMTNDNLTPGFYLLQIENEKKEFFFLKILLN